MTVRFEYLSDCCKHTYVEQRAADEPLFFPNCTNCEQGKYELVKETVISETIERVSAPEFVEPEVIIEPVEKEVTE